jgi:hypothetical protein
VIQVKQPSLACAEPMIHSGASHRQRVPAVSGSGELQLPDQFGALRVGICTQVQLDVAIKLDRRKPGLHGCLSMEDVAMALRQVREHLAWQQQLERAALTGSPLDESPLLQAQDRQRTMLCELVWPATVGRQPPGACRLGSAADRYTKLTTCHAKE